MRLCPVLFVFAVTVSAQSLTYTQLPVGTNPPAPRVDGTVAYDPGGRQIFMFGGLGPSARADLWAYSFDQNQWREVQPSGSKPSARFGHTLVFDSKRRRVILFGGQAGGFFNDTWAYDISANAWTKLGPAGPLPNERYGHSAIYETARDRMILSHGFTDSGRFDDTWAFEFATNAWRNISPSANRPLKRCLHHAVYDPTGGQMLLYGGCSSGFGPCPQGDLWSFDLASNQWTEKASQPSPLPRQHYGTAYDATRDRMIVFGGSGNGTLNDTWEYNPRTNSWRQLSIPNSPSARSRVEGTYAADRGAIYFFGGSTSSGNSNELWELASGVIAEQPAPKISDNGIINVFSGATGAVAPGEIVSIFGENLGPVEGVALGYDPQTNQLSKTASGVSVTWNGIASPLYFVRQDQVNIQVPYELADMTEVRLTVNRNGRSSAEKSVGIVATRPGLYPAVWNEDGSINSATNPATAGSIVILFATGQVLTGPASATGAPALGPYPEPLKPVDLQVGSARAEVLFRGQAPFTTGVMQINARVPVGLSGAQPVKLTVGDAASQPGVVVAIR